MPKFILALLLVALAVPAFAQKGQKVGQLAFVWLVPFLGAVVVLAVHRAAEAPSRRYRETPDPGDDFAMSGRNARNVARTLDGD